MGGQVAVAGHGPVGQINTNQGCRRADGGYDSVQTGREEEVACAKRLQEWASF